MVNELINELELVNASINILITTLKATIPQQTEQTEQSEQSEQTEQSEELSSPKCKVLTNKSKFLNDEQRKQVINYITNPQEQEVIKALQPHKRVSYIQKQLKEKYDITLSFYHTSNIIKTYII